MPQLAHTPRPRRQPRLPCVAQLWLAQLNRYLSKRKCQVSSSCAGKSAIWCQQGNFWPRNVAINYSNTEIPFWASIKGTCYTHILLEVTKTQYRRATRSWMTFFSVTLLQRFFPLHSGPRSFLCRTTPLRPYKQCHTDCPLMVLRVLVQPHTTDAQHPHVDHHEGAKCNISCART